MSSKQFHSQTVRARDLKFWHNVHHPLCAEWHMSYITCQVSGVRCPMFFLFFSSIFFLLFFFFKVVKLGLFSMGPTLSSLFYHYFLGKPLDSNWQMWKSTFSQTKPYLTIQYLRMWPLGSKVLPLGWWRPTIKSFQYYADYGLLHKP